MKQQIKDNSIPSALSNVVVGLKFRSKNFAMDAEIFKIHPEENTAEVLLKAKDGHEWLEKDWNLQHTMWGFENGEYEAIPEPSFLSSNGDENKDWSIEYCLDGGIFVNSGDEIICSIQGEDGKITPQMEANAALIAAAPDMYKALEALIKEHHKNYKWTTPELLKAKRALKKANPQ